MVVGDGTPGSDAPGLGDARAPAAERDSGGVASELELVPHLASIGRGRRWVAAEAVRQGVTDSRVRIIQLLSSELIANAILHGPPGGGVRVRVARSEDTFRVEVDDASATSPRLIPITRDGGGGRGLALVERLADRWGYERRETPGNTVWFEVRVSRPVPLSTSGTTTPPTRRPS